jgi:hypothetical protein
VMAGTKPPSGFFILFPNQTAFNVEGVRPLRFWDFCVP